ncbi:TPA: hypothetical protein ACWRP4_000868, partial [Staphylococcus aureus]
MKAADFSVTANNFILVVDAGHTRISNIKVLHQMWWVYNLKNYFKLQLLEFLLLGGQSIIGLGCL